LRRKKVVVADIAGAFIRGHQAGQAQQQHQQAMEESKLQQMVLKHTLDGLKIQDQIRARELAKGNFDLLHGQPAADLPSDAVTSQTPNLPSRNLAGVVQGLIQGGQGQGTEPGAPAPVSSSTPPSMPSTIAAPGAQAPETLTHPETTMVPRPVQIPGVEAFGGAPAVPGVSLRPRSMEDVIHAQVAAKLAEPYTLNEGARRFVGPQEVARGGSKPLVVGAGGTAVLNPDDPNSRVVTGGPGNSEFAQFQQIYAEQFGAKTFAALTPQQKAGAIPAFTKMKQDPTLAGIRLDAAEMRRAADEARAEQTQHMNDFRQYSGEIAQAQRKHAEAFRTWTEASKTAIGGKDAMTGKPLGDPPEYTPPSFDEWQAAQEAKRAPSKPPAAPGGASATAPAVGATVTMKDGRRVKITKLYPDGSFDGDPVK
jgi:hypothetical protein